MLSDALGTRPPACVPTLTRDEDSRLSFQRAVADARLGVLWCPSAS